MPMLLRMKYFHAASRDSGVRYMPTIMTVVSVAISMPTHIRPMLFDRRARFMEAMSVWYIA